MDSDKAELRAKGLATLRNIERDLDRSEELHRYQERGEDHAGSPILHEQYNDALRQLQQAGEPIREEEIRPAVTRRARASKHAPLEDTINLSLLRSKVKQMLARIDPQN